MAVVLTVQAAAAANLQHKHRRGVTVDMRSALDLVLSSGKPADQLEQF
jgi:hypothetical protein